MNPLRKRFFASFLFSLLTFAFASLCHAQGLAPEVTKVEPPNWWANHSVNPVRVLVRGKNLTGARVETVGSDLQVGLVC
ncbi:MAG: cyclomaltodextrinase N-terminal domain-containing protein [Pyrinomonadaceae bacterium]|nr:cyclomaltodextrinase N-terminal domain-containing protein [Pyrinomonadaceae bacterium]